MAVLTPLSASEVQKAKPLPKITNCSTDGADPVRQNYR